MWNLCEDETQNYPRQISSIFFTLTSFFYIFLFPFLFFFLFSSSSSFFTLVPGALLPLQNPADSPAPGGWAPPAPPLSPQPVTFPRPDLSPVSPPHSDSPSPSPEFSLSLSLLGPLSPGSSLSPFLGIPLFRPTPISGTGTAPSLSVGLHYLSLPLSFVITDDMRMLIPSPNITVLPNSTQFRRPFYYFKYR